MKWQEIRQKHPNKFILLGDLVEEKIYENKYRVLGGRILKVSDDGKEIRKLYQEHKKRIQKFSFPYQTPLLTL